jgi:hypothetical protein
VDTHEVLAALGRMVKQSLGRPKHPALGIGMDEERAALGQPAIGFVPADGAVTERCHRQSIHCHHPPCGARCGDLVEQPARSVVKTEIGVGTEEEALVVRHDGQAAAVFAFIETQWLAVKPWPVAILPIRHRQPGGLGAGGNKPFARAAGKLAGLGVE